MDMRTPLGRVRGLGSAKGGTQHFWHQRLTAIANVPLLIFTVIILVRLNGATHAEAVVTLSNPLVALGLLAALLSVCWHMKLGMQVVIEDYIHSEPAKFALIILNLFFCAAMALAGSFAILKLAFGG